MTTPLPETAVTLQSAYTAAVERARKTQDALMLAEAQILDLEQGLREVREQLTAADENHWRPTDEGPPEFFCPHKSLSDGMLYERVSDAAAVD